MRVEPRDMGMRRRLAQQAQQAQLALALDRSDGDESMDAVVRRFWSRSRPAHGARGEGHPVVVDLALWSKTHGRRGT
jgi:predicted kinase